MKIIALVSVGLLAAGTVAAVPAEAQRHGYGRYHGGYGYGGGYRGYRGGYGLRGGYRAGPRWRGGYGQRGYGWHRGPRWRGGYSRVVCRGGYYGRRCVRTY